MRKEPRPRIQILTFDGCPNAEGARELVDRVCGVLGIEAEVETLVVSDLRAARERHFLGSPTIRVNGRDIDPHSNGRADYVLSCRVYNTSAGLAGVPDEAWLRDALSRRTD